MCGEKVVPHLDSFADAERAYRITGLPLGVEVVPWARFEIAGDPVLFRSAGEVQQRDIHYPADVDLTLTATGPSGEAIELSDAILRSKHRASTVMFQADRRGGSPCHPAATGSWRGPTDGRAKSGT